MRLMRRLVLPRLLLTTFLLAAPWVGAAHAQGAAVADDALRAWAQREAAAQPGVPPGARIDVHVGTIDPRLTTAPCAKLDYVLPGGARLWGRSRVVAHCTDGSAWSIVVPVTVRVFGPALVALRPLPAQTPVGTDEVRLATVELTREAQGVVTDTAQLDGRVLARTVSTGQPIPLAALRAPQAVGQGDPVKVVGSGRGFSIAADAVAISSALDGQPVRVRMESGRVLTGTARSGRVVEVTLH